VRKIQSVSQKIFFDLDHALFFCVGRLGDGQGPWYSSWQLKEYEHVRSQLSFVTSHYLTLLS